MLMCTHQNCGKRPYVARSAEERRDQILESKDMCGPPHFTQPPHPIVSCDIISGRNLSYPGDSSKLCWPARQCCDEICKSAIHSRHPCNTPSSAQDLESRLAQERSDRVKLEREYLALQAKALSAPGAALQEVFRGGGGAAK